MTEASIAWTRGEIAYNVWVNPSARHLVVIAHGYGEHAGPRCASGKGPRTGTAT